MLNRLKSPVELSDIQDAPEHGIRTVCRDRYDLGSLPLEMIWASVNDILGHTRNQTDCMLVPIAQVHLSD